MNQQQQHTSHLQHRNKSNSFARRMSLPNHLDSLKIGSSEDETSPRLKPSKAMAPPPFTVIHSSTKNLDSQKIFVPLESAPLYSDSSNEAIHTPASPRNIVMVQKKGNAYMSKFKLEKPKKMKTNSLVSTLLPSNSSSSNFIPSNSSEVELNRHFSHMSSNHVSKEAMVNIQQQQQIPPPQVSYNPPVGNLCNSVIPKTPALLPSLQSVVESVVNDIKSTSTNQQNSQQQIQFLLHPYKS